MVLDIGCGEGYCARKLVDMDADFVLGVVSESMMQELVNKLVIAMNKLSWLEMQQY
jgi:hypothetical protein